MLKDIEDLMLNESTIEYDLKILDKIRFSGCTKQLKEIYEDYQQVLKQRVE